MVEPNACECSASSTLIFACSGAADVGELTDLAARMLARDGVGKMFCLAGVGGRVGGILEKTKGADRILAMDGCELDCARHTLEEAGISNFVHLRMTDLGMSKGITPVTSDALNDVELAARALLNGDGR